LFFSFFSSSRKPQAQAKSSKLGIEAGVGAFYRDFMLESTTFEDNLISLPLFLFLLLPF